ncbi:MAG TPA: formate--tetrahydrofolate ligase, partial [Candidatus Cloacimonadota bacterium]|nr:formate--tetrahydrofolate ligase [Candidatus Cloacimonadota bacterium]
MTDQEIAKAAKIKPIVEVAQTIGLTADDLEMYGKYKAKLSYDALKRIEKNEMGQLILVSAITPTPAGEGKTTNTIGLAQSLNKLGKKAIAAIREPSLGPVFGVKGGAAGGGYSQV